MRLIDVEPLENLAAVLRLNYLDDNQLQHTVVVPLRDIPTYGKEGTMPDYLRQMLRKGKPVHRAVREQPPAPGQEELTIDELELSVRSYNCLMRAGIKTLGDLMGKSEEELGKIRNMGKISLQEIKGKLAERGLKPAEGEETP